MNGILDLIDVCIRLFAFGLFVRVVMSWVKTPSTSKAAMFLDRIYDPCLAPLKTTIKPLRLNTTPPTQVDLSPIVLILLLVLVVRPFLIWVFH